MRRTFGHRTTILGISLLFALLSACVADRPLVERFEQGNWQPEPFEVTSLDGRRVGAGFPFVLRLEDPAGRRLIVKGIVEITPQAVLRGGSWAEEGGSSARSGVVSSAAVDFFGGQGDRPSLGGQFTLSAAGATVYRINLPATPLGAGR